MSRRRSTRTYRRTRRTRRRRYGLLDYLLIAGIVGGAVFLCLHTVLHAPALMAGATGLLVGGIVLGMKVPRIHVRAPIVVHRRRW